MNKLAKKRDSYSDHEHSILYSEVGGQCPLCMQSLLIKKPNSERYTKKYEVAHIYPLNPTPAQEKALVGYPAPNDFNDLENVIALCPNCHTLYDKDFALNELENLRSLKDELLKEAKAKVAASQHVIQNEINEILDAISLYEFDQVEANQLAFDVATIDQKLKVGMSSLQRREIKVNVVSFYVRIRDRIKILERQDQAAVKILQNQVNSYYLVMKGIEPHNKDMVFNNVARWISLKTGKSLLAAKVLTSFFVQNCEVFDVNTD